MSVSRRLAAHRAASASAAAIEENQDLPTPDEPGEDETENPKSKKKDKDMTTVTQAEHDAAVAAARQEGADAEKNRTAAVMASEHYEGRETLAKTLLATPLSADDIGKALAAAPKIEASSLNTEIVSQEKADEAARNEMKNVISQNVNSSIQTGGVEGDTSAKDQKGLMKAAVAQINSMRGIK